MNACMEADVQAIGQLCHAFEQIRTCARFPTVFKQVDADTHEEERLPDQLPAACYIRACQALTSASVSTGSQPPRSAASCCA